MFSLTCFGLVQCPDGLLIGANKLFKCPHTKRYTSPKQLLKDEIFMFIKRWCYNINIGIFLKPSWQWDFLIIISANLSCTDSKVYTC